MSTTTQAVQMPSPAFPPSPPPSPPRRRHKKHRSDPFLELENTPMTSPFPPASPENEPAEPQDPLYVRIILTPLYFTSFLLSLFLINRSDRARRTNSHAFPTPSALSYFSPTAWIDPEPYQDPKDSTWERRDSHTSVEPFPPFENVHYDEGKRKGWHLNKKIRKIAKLEISDAFEMRGRVIVLMLSVFAVACMGSFMGLKWVWGKLW